MELWRSRPQPRTASRTVKPSRMPTAGLVPRIPLIEVELLGVNRATRALRRAALPAVTVVLVLIALASSAAATILIRIERSAHACAHVKPPPGVALRDWSYEISELPPKEALGDTRDTGTDDGGATSCELTSADKFYYHGDRATVLRELYQNLDAAGWVADRNQKTKFVKRLDGYRVEVSVGTVTNEFLTLN